MVQFCSSYYLENPNSDNDHIFKLSNCILLKSCRNNQLSYCQIIPKFAPNNELDSNWWNTEINTDLHKIKNTNIFMQILYYNNNIQGEPR